MEILEDKALVFRTRNPDKYSVIPKHKVIERNDGGYDVAVYWGLDECRVLRNLGVKDVPSPITRRYNWPGRYKPMAHQVETAAFLTMHRKAFCFNDPGTGKTLAALWAADYLINIKHVRRVLILCPLSIMQSAWLADLSNSIIHRSAIVAHHTKASRRIEMIQQDYEFVIANYDGLNLIADEVIADGRFDLVIVDEANAYKTATTKRWKALKSILKPNTYLWMMTGTPAAQSPVDAYGLAKLVNPDNVPNFFTAWRDKVMNKITLYKWAPKADAKELVYEALQPAIRFTKEQCLDLPPVMTTTREVPLTPQQAKYYNLLKDRMLVQAAGETISAVNAAAGVSKLLQISCIAYNTPVLTQLGWMPICNVAPDDFVWDGAEWVRCDGAIFKGMRQTVVLDGVQMTPEHLVLTNSGWLTAQECLDGYASERFNRAAVWLPDRLGQSWYVHWENEESDMALPMRLRGRSGTGIPELALYTSPEREALRMSSWRAHNDARVDGNTPVQHLGGDAAKVSEPQRQRLQKLRRTGHNGLQALGKLIREFLGRHAGGLRQPPDTRPQECEQRVQQDELPLGYTTGTRQQHEVQSCAEHPQGHVDNGAGSKSVWGKASNVVRPTDTLQMAVDASTNHTGEVAVYDLVNCGPRNRFVVRGVNGEHLIVHNCGAVYTDDKEVVEFDAGPRLGVLEEILEETDRKVIIFALFRSSIDSIQTHLTKKNIANECIHGGVAANKRADIIHRFQHAKEPRVLVMQPQATAHGITLTAADTVVFFGPLMSVEQYIQCIARADRKGQNSDKVTVIHIQGSPIEQKMFKALTAKVSDNSLLTQMFEIEINS